MRAKRYGKIVNLASLAGRSTSVLGGAHYTTSKAAVLGLTRHAARAAAAHSVNVNSVAPGTIDSQMANEFYGPERLAAVAAEIPLGRLGSIEDVAAAALFLASDEASFITGATLDVNGGRLMI
jgi:NAD(P)-dependent dehydrogenase (short-subunit alcohol dehydrogenase family)